MRYGVLYADPPWAYRSRHTGGSMKSGAADKYAVLGVDELAALPVPEVAERAAVLFLWSTVPMLPEALRVLEAWGFTYKTKVTWHKTGRMGLGYWFRGAVEDLLLGVRGKVKAFRCQLPNFIEAPVGKHSEKPEEFRRLIERVSVGVTGGRLELFAREQHGGWTSLGLAIDGRDIGEALHEVRAGGSP